MFVLVLLFWFHSSEPIVRNEEMNRRTCTQTKFAAACQRRCEIATRHQTRRNLNPIGEYGVVDDYSKRVPAQSIDAASDSVRANPLKRFVVSSARKLKQVGRLRVPLRIRIAHIQVNITHFIAGESVLLSPLFLVVEPNQLRLDHVCNTSDGLITQISYRGLNSFSSNKSPCWPRSETRTE